jgi:hypothetical protein
MTFDTHDFLQYNLLLRKNGKLVEVLVYLSMRLSGFLRT